MSRAIAEAGLRDVWRQAYPDARTHPGYTWWAARPQVEGWNPSPQARQTRIDQLHAGGTIQVKDVRLVGEAGREGVAIGVTPWPSDHRALLATLEITPAPGPALVTAWPLRVTRGDELRVRARGFEPGSARGRDCLRGANRPGRERGRPASRTSGCPPGTLLPARTRSPCSIAPDVS